LIEANRLSAPGERAALERVERIVERVDGFRVEMLALSPDALLDPDEHARLVAELEAEAARCGRRDLLDEVRDRVRSTLAIRAAQPTRFDPVYRSPLTPMRAEDAAAVVMSVTDAVAVAVLEDRLAPETAARLAGPGRDLLGLPPLGARAAASVTRPAIPEPSADDWAEAATGEARTGDYTPLPVGVRVGVATMAATVLAPVAIFVGVGSGQTVAGMLAALAIVAVCWLVATYRR